jgi:hypothetical protein
MSRTDFSKKHAADTAPDPRVRQEIENRAVNNELACAVAFDIAKTLGVEPVEVGKAVDLMNVRLCKCQLGLFGYKPEKKIVKPQETTDTAVDDAIAAALVNDRLPCKSAWEIAKRFGLRKMQISAVCEAEGIKIKPCQLGAF